jgi:two-component system chemotaxis response regulator CheY
MPEMGGVEAVQEIMRGDTEARIIMCSALGQKKLVTDALQAGAKDFVVKPFEHSRLLEAVERVLR